MRTSSSEQPRFLDQRPDDLRNDLPRALDYYHVAFPKTLVGDVVFIVERGLLDRRSADVHRLEHRVGVDRACAPNIEPDVKQRRDRLLGGELVGDSPPRLPANVAQVLLVVEAVDLDDQAIAVVVEVVDLLQPAAVPVEHFGHRLELPVVGVDLEADLGQKRQSLPLIIRGAAALGVAGRCTRRCREGVQPWP